MQRCHTALAWRGSQGTTAVGQSPWASVTVNVACIPVGLLMSAGRTVRLSTAEATPSHKYLEVTLAGDATALAGLPAYSA